MICDVCCSGQLLATASGDGTVKLWDFSQARCTLTFAEHRQPGMYQSTLYTVHCTSHTYHTCAVCVQFGGAAGTGVGSSWPREAWTTVPRSGMFRGKRQSLSPSPCSHTGSSHIRGVCVYTLRGHADSVNTVHFLPYSNTLASASADKTLSLWDIRTVCPPPPASLAHAHSLTHSLTHSHTHSLTHTLTTHSLTNPLTHSLTHCRGCVFRPTTVTSIPATM